MVSEPEPIKTHDVGCSCGDCIVWYEKKIGDGRCPWCKHPLDIHKDAMACVRDA